MSEISWLMFLKNLSLICNGVGLVIAVLFLLGPKVLVAISKFVNTSHPTMSLEKILVTKARIILGITLLIITALMLSLATTIRV